MRPVSGMTFGGRYELSSRIAIGGMGEVWEATDLVIGRSVALKILKDEYLGDPGFLERFRAEARHAALVNHEGIANVYDYGEEDGSAFLVMELVPGEPLSAIIERDHALAPDRVLDIVAQVATALHAAHAAGLVHRDIKPGNLLITPEGRVKITDFGIARIADQVPLTATGQVMGTVQYLSPEQASGHAATPATDIYSLGIVAYECLAGRRPFTGESQVAIAMAQINDVPPDLPATVPEPVRRLVLACIAKAPSDRPTTAALLARAATALRRGDVLAAASAVPAVLPPGVAAPTLAIATDAATTVLPAQDAGFETTLFGLPAESPGAEEAEEETEPKKRSPWTWPLIVLIVLLAIVLVGWFVAQAAGSSNTSASSSVPKTTVTTSAPTSSTPATVSVVASDYIGSQYQTVVNQLTALGLKPTAKAGQAKQGSVGIVYSVEPQGNVPKGDSVTVLYYSSPAAPSTPSSAASLASGTTTPVTGDSSFQVTWPTYNSCPAGTTRTGYKVWVQGASSASNGKDQAVGANTTSFTITAGAAGSGPITVRYAVFCGQQDSAYSPSLSIPVEAVSTPTPTTSSGTTTPTG